MIFLSIPRAFSGISSDSLWSGWLQQVLVHTKGNVTLVADRCCMYITMCYKANTRMSGYKKKWVDIMQITQINIPEEVTRILNWIEIRWMLCAAFYLFQSSPSSGLHIQKTMIMKCQSQCKPACLEFKQFVPWFKIVKKDLTVQQFMSWNQQDWIIIFSIFWKCILYSWTI